MGRACASANASALGCQPIENATMSDKQQKRIIELQAQLKIARSQLERIASGCRCPEDVAQDVLGELMRLDEKYQLQGLVGHDARRL